MAKAKEKLKQPIAPAQKVEQEQPVVEHVEPVGPVQLAEPPLRTTPEGVVLSRVERNREGVIIKVWD